MRFFIFSFLLSVGFNGLLSVEDNGLGDGVSRIGTVVFDGERYEVDFDVCSGGVMFKGRGIVGEFCSVGLFSARPLGCVSDGEVVVGARDEYTCTSLSGGGGLQALISVWGGEGVRLSGGREFGERNVSEPFEHNSLIEKRGAVVEVEYSSSGEGNGTFEYFSDEGVGNDTLEDDDFEGGGAGDRLFYKRSGEDDTLPIESGRVLEGFPYEVGMGSTTELSVVESGNDTLELAIGGDGGVEGRLEGVGELLGVDFDLKEGYEEFSSERDEMGEWDGGEELPVEGTIEFDYLGGGIGKWVGVPPPSPLFDAHLTLLRRQVDFELIGGGVQTDGPSHVSVISDNDLAHNSTWFAVLSEIASTASFIVPGELFRDPFSGGGGGRMFFDDVLRIFGYFLRSFEGERDEGLIERVAEGFRVCRGWGEVFKGGISLRDGVAGCGGEVEIVSIVVREPVWNEYNASYVYSERRLDFSRGDLPPLDLTINPSKWVFAEVMWYAVQITYLFCSEAFTEDPNSFLRAYDLLVRMIFTGDLMKGFWEEAGGNLGVFEMMLPYVGGGRGLRGLLGELDKVAAGVKGWSVLPAFGGIKRLGGERGRRGDYKDVRRRRRRDVGGVEGGGNGKSRLWENVNGGVGGLSGSEVGSGSRLWENVHGVAGEVGESDGEGEGTMTPIGVGGVDVEGVSSAIVGASDEVTTSANEETEMDVIEETASGLEIDANRGIGASMLWGDVRRNKDVEKVDEDDVKVESGGGGSITLGNVEREVEVDKVSNGGGNASGLDGDPIEETTGGVREVLIGGTTEGGSALWGNVHRIRDVESVTEVGDVGGSVLWGNVHRNQESVTENVVDSDDSGEGTSEVEGVRSRADVERDDGNILGSVQSGEESGQKEADVKGEVESFGGNDEAVPSIRVNGDGFDGRGKGTSDSSISAPVKVISQTGWFRKVEEGLDGVVEGSDPSKTDSESLRKSLVISSTELDISSTTLGPPIRTSAPMITTSAPTITTSAPMITTSAPTITTSAPAITTSAPTITTSAPAITTSAPTVTTSAPPRTTLTTSSTTPLVQSTTTTTPPTNLATPSVETTPGSTTTGPTTTTRPTTIPLGTMKQFEIWDGRAYCLVRDENGGLSPSLGEFKASGVCGY